MTDKEVVAILRSALCQALPERKADFEVLTMETVISELAIDSLRLMEAISIIEDKLGRTFEEDELAKAATVRDLGSLIRYGHVPVESKVVEDS